METFDRVVRFKCCRLGANRRHPVNDRVKDEIWDLATSTVIAVSLTGSMAFIGLILIGAIH